MKFLGKVGNGPTNKLLDFGVDRIRIRISRQFTLARRILAEVCSVHCPMLLIIISNYRVLWFAFVYLP